jgi:hypothetical protein
MPVGADTGATGSDAGSPPPAGAPKALRAGPPVALRVAAVAQAAEALVLFIAAVFAAVATVDGKAYERASGIALTLIAVGTAAGLAAFAVGLARARAWTRTPVVMTQLFVGGAGIYLVNGHRLDWGIPTLALAAICLAGVFAPASLRALNRGPLEGPDPEPAPEAPPTAADTKVSTKTAPARTGQKAKTRQNAQQSTQTSQGAKTGQNAKTGQGAKTGQNAKRPPANRKRKPRR